MATKKVTPAAAKTTAKKATTKKATAKKATTKKVVAAKTTKTTKAKTTKPVFTEADIRKKAEELYNARLVSGEAGSEESDWLNAEKALKAGK